MSTKREEQCSGGDEADILTVLMRRVNVWISVTPVFLFVTISAISVLLYILFRRWRQKLTTPRGPPQVEAPPRRALPQGAPPGYNSQVTLPLYSPPPPPPYPDEPGTEAESISSIELPVWRQGRPPEQEAEEQQPSPAPSPAPRELAAAIDSREQEINRHTKACT